jgi:uncharacterized protein
MLARRSNVAVLALALIVAGACKKEEKPAGAGTGSAAAAPIDAAALPTPDPASLLARPYLWEVAKDGKKISLFGTMHLGVDAEKSLPTYVWARLDAARTFVMEADATDPGLIATVLRKDGTTLDQELGPAHWTKFEELVGKDAAESYKRLKSSSATVLVTVQGLPMTLPMDLVLAARARSAGKKVQYLEEARMQQALLDKWMDTKALKAMLDDVAKVRENNVALLAAYRGGDEAALIAVLDDKDQWKDLGLDDKAAAAAMDELLYARNRAWIAPLEALFAEGSAFVGVGVAHLVGPQSVIELLEKKGYQVTRVTGP